MEGEEQNKMKQKFHLGGGTWLVADPAKCRAQQCWRSALTLIYLWSSGVQSSAVFPGTGGFYSTAMLLLFFNTIHELLKTS